MTVDGLEIYFYVDVMRNTAIDIVVVKIAILIKRICGH